MRNVTVAGITFRDTAYTYMDPHGMPSGGDWCLQRSAALVLNGTEDVTLRNLTLTRVDGNGVFLDAYNRRAAVLDSEFRWVGDTAIALWGRTEALPGGDPQPAGTGINGTGGNQPRFTTISGNIIHEIGCVGPVARFACAGSCFAFNTDCLPWWQPRSPRKMPASLPASLPACPPCPAWAFSRHYQKQSSCIFQAQACQTTITHNIFYNGPRAQSKLRAIA